MLAIHAQQWEALRVDAEHQFLARVCAHLRAAHRDDAAEFTPEGLTALVEAAVARARGYGLVGEDVLAAFCALALLYGAFDRHPLFHALLQDETTPPERRLHALVLRTNGEDWDRLRESRRGGG